MTAANRSHPNRFNLRQTLLLLVSTLLVLFVSNTRAQDDRPFAGTELNFIAQPDVFAEPVRRLLPRFEEETGIRVNMETLPYASLRERQVSEFIAQGNAIDLMTMDIVWMGEYAEAGWIEPLGAYVEAHEDAVQLDDFLPGAMAGLALWNGKMYGMPLGAYYYLLHYRTDVLEAAGIDPLDRPTLDEVVDVIRQVHNPPEMHGFSAGYRRGAPVVHDSLAYYIGMGGALFVDFPRDLTPNMYTELGLKVYEFYKDMLNYAPPGAITFDFRERREAFQQGRVAVHGSWSSSSAAFIDARDSVPEVVENVGFTYLPRASTDADPVVPFGGWALVINAFSDKKDAAWEFIKWFSSPEIQKLYAADGGTPFRYSTVSDPELQADRPWYELILQAEAEGWVRPEYRPRFPPWPRIEEEMGVLLSEAMAGEREIADALQRIDNAIERILREEGYMD
jgi:multiple sugar transport system substrate-binding protein